MKTHDANTEAQILRAILDSEDRAFVLSQVDIEYFGHETVLEIFRRIMVFVNAGKPIPTSQVFQNDETMSEGARALIANPEYALNSYDDILAALEILKKYRKARILFHTINQAVGVLQQTIRQNWVTQWSQQSWAIISGKGDYNIPHCHPC